MAISDLVIPHEEWHNVIWWGDPGGKTGWCSYALGKFEGGILRKPQHHLELWQELESFYIAYGATNNIIIGMEGFEFRQNTENSEEDRKGLELVSKEYIGVAKLFCMTHGLEYAEMTASEGKGFMNNDKLNRAGIIIPGTLVEYKDMYDAARHLIHYMLFKKRIRDGLMDKIKKRREE